MSEPDRQHRWVVGTMTGTSLDGIDVSLVRIEGTGLEITATPVRHASRPMGELARDTRRATQQAPRTAGQFAQLANSFAELHIEAISELLKDGHPVDIIATPGQTVYHNPPLTWQLLNPAPIARRFACPVVFDFRQADVAAGGQGAPITPLADWVLFRDSHRRRAIVNFGGFCNATYLPRADELEPVSRIRGCDVCTCNHLLDAVARTKLHQRYDEGGAAAMAGEAVPELVESLMELLTGQAVEERSLGTDDEAADWVSRHQAAAEPNDLAASAASAIGSAIAQCLNQWPAEQVIVAGGGAHNEALFTAVDGACKAEVIKSNEVGVPVNVRESAEIAVLGALCADGIPISLPKVTGCEEPAPVAGAWCLPGSLVRANAELAVAAAHVV